MWIETDRHGLINLSHVKRIDLAGDMEKKTYGVYLFDVNDNTYPIVDLPRFESIGILKDGESVREAHVAMYTFYILTRKLVAGVQDRDVITTETIYREFASTWHKETKKEKQPTEESATAAGGEPQPAPDDNQAESLAASSSADDGKRAKVHDFADMRQLLEAYSAGYLKKTGKKPTVNYRSEGRIASQLLKLYSLQKLKTMLTWYFDSKDDFIVKAAYDMKTFRTIIERAKKASSSNE
jgi:hypothetical protein